QSATTVGFNVTPQPATHLVVTTQPPLGVVAGDGFTFVVAAENDRGQVDTGFNRDVTVALASNPGGATLGGPLAAAASAGVATFPGLTLDKAGGGYKLRVSCSGLASATTASIAVAPRAATHLVVTTQPPAPVSAGIGFALTVSAEDDFGNVAPTFAG